MQNYTNTSPHTEYTNKDYVLLQPYQSSKHSIVTLTSDYSFFLEYQHFSKKDKKIDRWVGIGSGAFFTVLVIVCVVHLVVVYRENRIRMRNSGKLKRLSNIHTV